MDGHSWNTGVLVGGRWCCVCHEATAMHCIANEKHLNKKIRLPFDLQRCCMQPKVGADHFLYRLLRYLNFHKKCFQNEF